MSIFQKTKLILSISAAALMLSAAAPSFAGPNKDVVVAALKGLFIDKDVSAVDKYWAADYIQHNPMGKNGNAELKMFPPQMLANVKYQMGAIVEEGDMVMVHGRYEGIAPKPMIAVDIYRVKDGKLVEHWDVLQEEVEKTASGNPMFTQPHK